MNPFGWGDGGKPQSDDAGKRPGLVVTNDPPPPAIYRPNSRDVTLGDSMGAPRLVGEQPLVTEVTRRVEDLSRDFDTLRKNTAGFQNRLKSLQAKNDAEAAEYYEVVASINTELQSGSTPGNPLLLQKWGVAQQKLGTLSQNAGSLDGLATDLAGESTKAAFLQDNIRAAYSLSGAIKEDHARLRDLEDDVNRTIVHLQRLLTSVSDEVNRRGASLRSEQLNLKTLALAISNGELYGQNMSNSLFKKAMSGEEESMFFSGGIPDLPPVKSAPLSQRLPDDLGMGMGMDSASMTAIPLTPVKTPAPEPKKEKALQKPAKPVKQAKEEAQPKRKKPLVIIRFDRPGVDYEQALYAAISQALDKYPAAKFDLVAISPAAGNPAERALASSDARKHGEEVLRSLVQMGLPMERINPNAAVSTEARAPEVHIFLR